jgi:uncharacterized integral membrane protein
MEGHPPEEPRTERLRWKPWAVGAALLVLAIFVAQNSQKVEVDFIFAETDTPLVFALLIAGALGALIGWLAPKLGRDERRD